MGAVQQQHFLVVTYPLQGHINPALYLANRLARTTGSPRHRITFSTAVSGHRKMFPGLASPNQEFDDGLISYVPFSDGHDEGFKRGVDDVDIFLSDFKLNGSSSLSSIIHNLDSRGHRVTCVIYTFFVPWAADIADHHGIPSAHYWIQPATVFAVYYHYFHGYDTLVAKHTEHLSSEQIELQLPGLQPMQLRDLPSFVMTTPGSPYYFALNIMKEATETLDRMQSTAKKKPKVLVNTFDELEAKALAAVDSLDLIAVGPILSSTTGDSDGTNPSFDLFKPDAKGYIEWLDSKPERSVVYVSFGSLAVVQKQQAEEILKGLKASGKPYLWVVRKDSPQYEEEVELEDDGENGMVVEWCTQMKVLAHPAVGCFVTHCGWNSTLESLVCGVPTIGIPQLSDQGTNAMLMEKQWGTGLRGKVNREGVLEGEELERCLGLVMGEGEKAVEVRKNSESWKEKAKAAVLEGGSSDRNLRSFIDDIIKFDQQKNL